MPVQSLKPLVEALLAQLPDDPSSIVISVKSETETEVSTNGQKSTASGPNYDPALVYLLEFCTILALRDNETVLALGADVAEALMNIMRNAGSYHSILISRSMFYLLHLLHASYVSPTALGREASTDSNSNTILYEFQSYFTRYQVSRKISSTDLRRLCFRAYPNVSRSQALSETRL